MTDPQGTPAMNERERIQALLDVGRISKSDAELLWGALEDEDAAYEADETTLDSLDGAASEAKQGAVPPPLPPEPPHPPGAPSQTADEPWEYPYAGDAEDNFEHNVADITHWLKIAGGCGDLSVTVDPSLDAPSFTGEGVLEQDGADYRLRTPSDWQGGNWLSKLRNLVGNLEVGVPEGYGVALSVFAGDAELRGVRAIKGKFTGGDLSVHGAESLELNVTSGDVTLTLRPTRGHHQLRATSGDVTLTFLKGSDVTVSGKATAGNVSVPKGFGRSGSFGSSRVQGTIGGGRAKLELRLTAGNVELRTEDA